MVKINTLQKYLNSYIYYINQTEYTMHLEAKTLNGLVSDLLDVEAELGNLIAKQIIFEMEQQSLENMIELEEDFARIQDKREAILYFIEHHN